MNRRHILSPRILIATVAVLLMSFAAAPMAGALTADKGAVGLSFLGISRNGEIIKVKQFNFTNLPVDCTEGPTTYTPAKPLPGMKVVDREFKGKFTRGAVTTAVTGKYKRSLQKATGTLKVTGDIGSFTNCNSGKVTWKAE
jgi:hypothetical protein